MGNEKSDLKTSKTKLYKQPAARRAKFNGSTLKMNQVLNKQGFTNYEARGLAKRISIFLKGSNSSEIFLKIQKLILQKNIVGKIEKIRIVKNLYQLLKIIIIYTIKFKTRRHKKNQKKPSKKIEK